jgi:hypothetical protein
VAEVRATAAVRSHWTRKLDAQSRLVIKALEDLYVMVAEAAEAGVKQPDIAYNIPDISAAAIMEGRGTGIHSTAITPKVKVGLAIKARRKGE